jgi:hypothetical protein
MLQRALGELYLTVIPFLRLVYYVDGGVASGFQVEEIGAIMKSWSYQKKELYKSLGTA